MLIPLARVMTRAIARTLRYRFGAGAMVIALGCVLPAFATVPAHADFRVCNATQSLVGVAIGYRSRTGWVTEGWWHVEGSSCKTLIEGALSSRYYYLYAEDASGSGRWTGYTNMCVAEDEFEITGVQDCFARGYQQMGFSEYDTGREESWTVQLSDTPSTQESQN